MPLPTPSRSVARPLSATLVGLGLLLVAACSAGSSATGSASERSSADLVAPATAAADGGAAKAAGGSSASGAAVASIPVGTPADVDRSVISTATLRVRVGNRAQAEDRAKAVAARVGGEVFSEEADLQGQGDTTLTLKVPPARFDSVLTALAGLGTALERHRSVEDVTDQVVDLQGRLKTARASADRLRALLSQAPDVQGVVAVESELTTRESEVESLEGRMRVLSAQVDLATIELQLTERGEPKVDHDIPGFMQGFRHGWVSFRNAVGGGLTAVGFLVPFLAVAIPFGLVLRWRLRRARRRATPPAVQAA